MAKLTADLTNAQAMTVYDKDEYPCHITKVDNGPSKSNPMAQQLTVRWKPEGEKAGDNPATVADWVQWSGKAADGEPVNISKLCQYINALHVPWECNSCHTESQSKLVEERGKFFCPNCGKQASISFDPDLWIGKRAMVRLDVGKMLNSDEMTNNVKRVRELTSA